MSNPRPTDLGVINVGLMLDLALGGNEPGIINFNLLHYVLCIMARELKIFEMPVEFLGEEAVKIKKMLKATLNKDKRDIKKGTVAILEPEEGGSHTLLFLQTAKGQREKDKTSPTVEPKNEEAEVKEKYEDEVENEKEYIKEEVSEIESTADGDPDTVKGKELKKSTRGSDRPTAAKAKDSKSRGSTQTKQSRSSSRDNKYAADANKRKTEGKKGEMTPSSESTKKESSMSSAEKDKRRESPVPSTEKEKTNESATSSLATGKKGEVPVLSKDNESKQESRKVLKITVKESLEQDDEKELGALQMSVDRVVPDTMEMKYRINSHKYEYPSTAYFGLKVDKEEYDAIKDECEDLKHQMDELRDIVEGTAGVMKEHHGILREGANVMELFTVLNAIKRVEAIEATMSSIVAQHASSAQVEYEYANSPMANMTIKEALLYLHNTIMIVQRDMHNMNVTEKVNRLISQLNQLEEIFNNQIASTMSTETVEEPPPIQWFTVTNDQLLKLFERVHNLEISIQDATRRAELMLEEKSGQQSSLLELQRQIHALRQAKAEREEVDDALLTKVDICAITTKVSYDTFDSVTEELTKAIDQALNKLDAQEDMWQEALNDLQTKIFKKVDKSEMGRLRDFINSKILALHTKLKTLSDYKKEREGAATRFLKNVSCISCDTNVVMKRHLDDDLKIRPEPLPPIQSMAPYLTYELDYIRKQKKCGPPGANSLNYLEDALKQSEIANEAKHHVCNRYCGGEHTITTPQQRVSRLGHFLEQWGNDLSAVVENDLKGIDGIYYKGENKKKNLTKSDGLPPVRKLTKSTLPSLSHKSITLVPKKLKNGSKNKKFKKDSKVSLSADKNSISV